MSVDTVMLVAAVALGIIAFCALVRWLKED